MMRVVLDACVLFPAVLREILLGVAAQDRYTPLWSARILGEWQRAAARLGPDGALQATHAIARCRADWPESEIADDPSLEGRLWLPDPADAHVLATAISGRASTIVTLNLRDFPGRALAPEKVSAQSPDDFLMTHWLCNPESVERSVSRAFAQAAALSGRQQAIRPALKRAKLPRLGKALG